MADFVLYLMVILLFLAIDIMLASCIYFSDNAGVHAFFILMLVVYNGIAFLSLTLYFVQPQWLKRLRKFI